MKLEKRGSHKDLILWRKAMELATVVHHLARLLPSHEIFGLISQIRRSAVSIPSNIAEGTARRTTREFMAFLHIARGSSAELDTQLQLARNVGYLSDADLAPALVRLDEVGRILNGVINGLRQRQEPASSLSPNH